MSRTISELAWKVLDDMAERDEDGNVTLRGKAVEIADALNAAGDATMRLAKLLHEEITGEEIVEEEWSAPNDEEPTAVAATDDTE